MRSKLLILTAGLTALVMPAQAQDLLGWPEPSVDWSGFYAGVFAGYGLDTGAAKSETFLAPEFGQVSQERSRMETLIGGGELGYNLQYGAAVFGINADLALGTFSESRSVTGTLAVDDPPGANGLIDGQASWAASAIGTVTGRLGIAAGNWLIYGKGGLAVTNVRVDGRIAADIDIDLTPGQLGTVRREGLHFGTVVGVGIDGMVTDNVSIGAEYTYTAFPEVPSSTASVPGFGGGSIGAPDVGPVSLHGIKLGAKYHF